jgi:hypothetical protein
MFFDSEDTWVAKRAPWLKGTVFPWEMRGKGSLRPFSMVALGGIPAHISPDASVH